ncbi:unnamed protein product [Dibothriocephalus latus]|uniref:Uncharacterized protein n=1 Tax=Dibothriocephalus latus TaxID=60516 RepID=A0A3P6R1D4_DIBLA|nr:unnamed protein product [Dibothriocephalus latus]
MPSGYSPSRKDKTKRRSRKRRPAHGFKQQTRTYLKWLADMNMSLIRYLRQSEEDRKRGEEKLDRVLAALYDKTASASAPVDVPFLTLLSTISKLDAFNKALSRKQYRQRIVSYPTI